MCAIKKTMGPHERHYKSGDWLIGIDNSQVSDNCSIGDWSDCSGLTNFDEAVLSPATLLRNMD